MYVQAVYYRVPESLALPACDTVRVLKHTAILSNKEEIHSNS